MKHILALAFLGILSWYAPETWTTGEPIEWDAVADMSYIPCYSPYSPTGPWTEYPPTDLLWAELPDPPPGKTLYYSCRVMYCPGFICGEPSGYAPPLSDTTPRIKGRGKAK